MQNIQFFSKSLFPFKHLTLVNEFQFLSMFLPEKPEVIIFVSTAVLQSYKTVFDFLLLHSFGFAFCFDEKRLKSLFSFTKLIKIKLKNI